MGDGGDGSYKARFGVVASRWRDFKEGAWGSSEVPGGEGGGGGGRGLQKAQFIVGTQGSADQGDRDST